MYSRATPRVRESLREAWMEKIGSCLQISSERACWLHKERVGTKPMQSYHNKARLAEKADPQLSRLLCFSGKPCSLHLMPLELAHDVCSNSACVEARGDQWGAKLPVNVLQSSVTVALSYSRENTCGLPGTGFASPFGLPKSVTSNAALRLRYSTNTHHYRYTRKPIPRRARCVRVRV